MYIEVLQDYRNKGIAKRLLEYTIQELKHRNVERLTLEVRKSNIIAIGFYKKMGFVQIAERYSYYSEPTEDALVLCLEL